MRWLLLGAAIVAEVTAALALQAAVDAPGWYALVVAGYLTAFGFLTRVLKAGMAVGVAYGIWGASGVALTAVGATVLFGQPLTGLMILGLVLIVAGVLLVELGSQRAHAARAVAGSSEATPAAATRATPTGEAL
ncbi:QacE family quaternary ammonium compound efflux SMR transporter [Clavibacter lycopersici]|uniref:QacE family quaternary ammonium compound efflux SMR transporter n=1 Tax=Clavibacter lycopersici TaxID=2301718 RepID=A0A399TCU3_9MICO|nr:SMR family transporter [Clavibacter lycopersici]RIJ53288.1 QacE family quaternary ammonium compound efflux SMR transporter [Clavibacter lycopersici]RIJ62239.1 QacE family quaternary ammonium compound efflux SMR transporter [Clavibacter lycopersici]